MNNDGVKNHDTEFVVYYSVFQFLYDSNKPLLNTRFQKSIVWRTKFHIFQDFICLRLET